MATDYDAPRRSAEEELETDSLEGLKAAEKAEPAISDTDDGEIVEPFELPMEEVSGEELSTTVTPKQNDEFTCSECFLVQHRSRVGEKLSHTEFVCIDCV